MSCADFAASTVDGRCVPSKLDRKPQKTDKRSRKQIIFQEGSKGNSRKRVKRRLGVTAWGRPRDQAAQS